MAGPRFDPHAVPIDIQLSKGLPLHAENATMWYEPSNEAGYLVGVSVYLPWVVFG